MSNKIFSPFQAMAISFGAIIGWGAYIMPGDLFLTDSGVLGSSLAILLGAILILIIAQSYMNLLAITPDNHSGGVYWINKYLGKSHAFIYGWCILLGYIAIIALNLSAIPLLVRYLLPENLIFGYLYTIAGWRVYVSDIFLCILTLYFFCFVNYKGVRVGASFQAYFAIFMILAVLSLFVGSYAFGINHSFGDFDIVSETDKVKNLLWLSIIAVMPWAYVGFETTPQISKAIQSSRKKTKLIILISVLFGSIFYLLVNLMTAINMSFNYNTIQQSSWATGIGIQNAIGSWGMIILSLAMTLSILSGINGFILSSLKVMESMYLGGLMPSFFSNAQSQISEFKAISLIFLLCILAPWLGRNILLDIVSLSSVGISLGFMYVVIADMKSQCLISNRIKPITYLSLLISIGFLALLLLPISPAALSANSLVVLFCFFLLGFVFLLYTQKKKT